MNDKDFKTSILTQYCERFQPGDETNANTRKSSQEIMLELRPMAEFSINEIADFLNSKNYIIGFYDDYPVWLMYNEF